MCAVIGFLLFDPGREAPTKSPPNPLRERAERIKNLLVATITGNLSRRQDAAHLFIDVSTPEGAKSGLSRDSLTSCLNLAVIPHRDIGRKIGELSDDLMAQVDDCLKAALGLP